MEQGFTQHGRLWNGIHELVESRQFKRNVIPFQAGCSTKEYLGTVYPSCYLRGLVMFRVYSGAFTSLLNQEQRGNVYRDAMALAK